MGLGETARLIASLELDTKKFGSGVSSALKGIDKIESRAERVGVRLGAGLQSAAKNIRNIALVGAGAGVGLLVKSIDLASDLAETQSKVRVVFGESADEILAWGKTASTALGVSEGEAEAAAGTFGNLFVAMGFANDKSAEMSSSLVDLASDLASFNNQDPTEVLEKLRSGLTGEFTPLKTLGVNINEAILKQKAFDLGLTKSTTAVLPAAIKAQAAYALIFEQTATAQGDFARTSGGLANQQRILKAQFKDMGAIIGTAVLPGVTKLANKLTGFLNDPATKKGIQDFADKLPGAFDKALEFASAIPWGSIKDALVLGGQGAKIAMDAFLSAPPWLKTAIITGWGLNKLTGGALGGIVGELGKGLIKGVLGMTAGVVNAKAGVVNVQGGVTGAGAAAGTAAAGGGRLGSALQTAGTAVAVVGGVVALNQVATGKLDEITASVDGLSSQQASQLIPLTQQLNTGITTLGNLGVGGFNLFGLTQSSNNLLAALNAKANGPEMLGAISSLTASERADNDAAYARLGGIRDATGNLTSVLQKKNFNPTIITNVTSRFSVSARLLAQETTRYITQSGRAQPI